MFIRTKITLVTFFAVAVFVFISLGTTAYFTLTQVKYLDWEPLRIGVQGTKELTIVRIDRCTVRAIAVAGRLREISDEKIKDTLCRYLLPEQPESTQLLDMYKGKEETVDANTIYQFTSLSVLEEGKSDFVAAVGDTFLYKDLLEADCVKQAFEGKESRISTTIFNNKAGEMQFLFCVNIRKKTKESEGQPVRRILVCTVGGTYFSDVLTSLKFWQITSKNGVAGHIGIFDNTGKMIASNMTRSSEHKKMVEDGFSYIEAGKIDKKNFGNVKTHFERLLQHMTRVGDADKVFVTDTCIIDGISYCTFTAFFPKQKADWFISAAIPVSQLSSSIVFHSFIHIGIACILLAVSIAFLVSWILIKSYNEVIEKKEEAIFISETKSNFFAKISHEIRTPLNAIIGYSELAQADKTITETTAETFEKIYSAGTILLGIINDLLDISKIEAGKLEIIEMDYDLPSVINDVVAINTIRIDSKPIQFKLEVDSNLPMCLIGDELRVKQIINNLLSNAFKYTRKGQIELTFKGEIEDGKFYFVITVKDTGIGIHTEDLQRIFQIYQQADSEINYKIEGTGLGLPIVQRFCERMGGRIDVESEYGIGSVFTARIRQTVLNDMKIGVDTAYNLMYQKHSYRKYAKSIKLIRSDLSFARVLIVDDIQTNLDIAVNMFSPYKLEVDTATSGMEAVELIREEKVHYDAVFLDHMMPDIDGIETARIIRKEIGTEYAANVPIIAMTANAVAGNEEMFLANGFNAFISKPIDLMRLDLIIRRWIRDNVKETGLSCRADSDDTGIDSAVYKDWDIPGINKEKWEVFFGDNSENVKSALKSYITHTPAILSKLKEVSEETLNGYSITVHGLKGSSRGICAEEIGEKAERLEHAAKSGDYESVRTQNDVLIKEVETLIDNINKVLNRTK